MKTCLKASPFINKFIFNSIRSKSGTVSVETMLIFIPMMSIIFFIFELSRFIYISSVLDLASAEASRYAAISSLTTDDFRSTFYKKLKKDIPLWPLLIKDDNISIDVRFCNTIDDVIIDNCDNNQSDKPLAIYKMNYNYHVLFSIVEINSLNTYLQRVVVYVQEYKRDKK